MGVLKFIGRTFVSVFTIISHLAIFIAKGQWRFVKSYIHTVNDFTGNGTLGIDGSAKETHALVRYPIRAVLWLFVPLVVLFVPIVILAAIGGILIAIDQATYPSFPVDDVFTTIDASKDGSTAKGNLMLTASYHQMEKELNSTFGWTPNDILGGQFWDNRVNRQLGERLGSIELLSALVQQITKFGSTNIEDKRLTNVRQGGFTNDPTYSVINSFPSVESRYWDAINDIKSYQADVAAGKEGDYYNITNANIAAILDTIRGKDGKGVLEIPHARLIHIDQESWSQVDDDFFLAQGAAIVARDELVAIRSSYSDKIAERGALQNLDNAIASLNEAINVHTFVVFRGGINYMMPNQCAILANLFDTAMSSIDQVAKALRG